MTQVFEIDKYGNFPLKMSAICIFGVEELRNVGKKNLELYYLI